MGTPHLSGDQAHASPCTSLTMLRNPVQQTNTSGYQYAGRSLAGACTALIFFTYPGAVTCRDVLLLPPTIETATESARENIHSTALRIQSSGLAVLEYSSSFAAGVLEVGKSMGTEVVKAAQPDTALTVWNHSNNAPTYYSVIAAAVAFSSFAAAAWFVMSSNAVDDTDAPSKGANLVIPKDQHFCADVHQAEAAEHRHVSSEELKTAFERLHDHTNLQEQALALFNRSEEDLRSLASTPVGGATATKTSTPSVPVARRMWRTCCHCDELFNRCCTDGDESGIEETEHLHRTFHWASVARGICDSCIGMFSIFDSHGEKDNFDIGPALLRSPPEQNDLLDRELSSASHCPTKPKRPSFDCPSFRDALEKIM